MDSIFGRCSDRPRNSKLRARRPSLEGLEDRFLLYAANGGHWVYPARVTYSFMPDGTDTGGVASTLFQTMNAVAATATWEQQFQKAAAVWEAVANINLVEVSDSGDAMGTAGDQQGDSRFGDIRIGAVPLTGGALAEAFLPPPINGGTLAGDILFNSSTAWQIGTGYDIETVAIHEIGHALGMDHSQISQAVMYAQYNGVKQSLNSDDIAGIDSIYGAVPADTTGNSSSSTATDITSKIDCNGQIAIGGMTIVNAADQDWFKVTVPSSTNGTVTISMQSSNLSSLSPRLNVYNASLQSLGQVVDQYTYGATATLTISGVTTGQVIYIRAMAANGGATGTGAYGLLVNFGTQTQPPIAPPNTVVTSQPNQGGGSENLSNASHHHAKLPSHHHGHHHGAAVNAATEDLPSIVHVGKLSGHGDSLMASVRSFHGRHGHG